MTNIKKPYSIQKGKKKERKKGHQSLWEISSYFYEESTTTYDETEGTDGDVKEIARSQRAGRPLHECPWMSNGVWRVRTRERLVSLIVLSISNTKRKKKSQIYKRVKENRIVSILSSTPITYRISAHSACACAQENFPAQTGHTFSKCGSTLHAHSDLFNSLSQSFFTSNFLRKSTRKPVHLLVKKN